MKSHLRCHGVMVIMAVLCFFSFSATAQAPANDNCAGAILLTPSTSCNPVTGTFINATKSAAILPWAQTYSSSASPTYAAGPIVVECWGGGGAGGGANTNTYRGGGGGGGGYTYNNTTSIGTAGVFPVVVGAGGTGGTGNGGAGVASSFNGVSANGGGGGFGGSTAGSFGAGGTGGTYNGGNGSAAVALTSTGAGGGGAGSGGTGGTASGTTAGAGGIPDGGAGGAGITGATANSNGNAGSTYGGGGSGGVRTTGTNRNGGNGANGFVRVSVAGDLNSPDVWYRFVATATNPTIVLSNVDTDLVSKGLIIELLSGSCGSQTHLGTSNTNSLSTSGLTVGNTYYIRIVTNTNFASPGTGAYDFDICIENPLPAPTNSIDYSKSYINITDGTAGGTIDQNDILEIRATLVVKAGTITNVSYIDTLKRNAGLIFKDSIAVRTNEGKNYGTYTIATGDDQGWKAPIASLDTVIQINMGTGATSAAGGSFTNTSKPSLFGGTCVIMATYRVRVDTGTVGYGRKICFGGGAFRYTISGTNYIIAFPKDSLIVYPNLTACSDGVSPGNLIGSASNGTFGTPAIGSSASGIQNGGPAAINTTYNYETFSYGPNDYYYGITNNTSIVNSTVQYSPKPGSNRVFSVWDITGDHTGAANTARGNLPCNPSLPVSATNPCGYMLTINSSYKSDKVFEYTASGVCSETYYEVSAWFKNLCSRCGCDANGNSSGAISVPAYIPTAPGDSSGVRPNIAMQIDGIDYYTTGEILYQGLGSTATATDTLNNWVRRSFVFKTGPSQTSFKVTFRNNAPGGGGNDWAIDDIGLRTCYPTMIYSPSNPIAYMGNSLTITDTVRSYYNSYTYYKWQKKPVSGSWADVVPAATGNATPVYNAVYGQYEYVISYTIPCSATLAANSGDEYRMIVASNAANLSNGCNFVPSTTYSLYPADAPCALAGVNVAIAPQTGNINWNKLSWSLGHVPTCCESAQIIYNSSKGTSDKVIVDITNDICIINLTLINNSTSTDQVFTTILHPGYNMLMNGNVRMGAPGTFANDSCVFIARGGGRMTVNGNTVIGYPTDNAYCVFGSSPDIASNHDYLLKGDSLTFNSKSFTNDKLITVTMNPLSGNAYLVNNTNVSPFPNAVTFENFKIGNGSAANTVTLSGTNSNSFMNNRGGALEVTTNGTLVMPSDYTINARSAYNSTLQLRSNSTLRIGGYTGGTTGSNFPANFTAYSADPQSSVEYYGGSSNSQTVFGTTYGKLELRNGINAAGAGRAQKNSTAAITAATLINVNQNTDFTLGTLGSSTQTISSGGAFNVAAASGLYCNANVISGSGIFTMGNGTNLGIGHAQGISALGSATGNIQMTGGRNFTTTGNYTYNGIVNQITGNGLPATCNDLTISNATTVKLGANAAQTVNGTHYLTQGTFIIDTAMVSIMNTINKTGGLMKANMGTLNMAGNTATVQNLSGSWFVNRNISTLINSNTSAGITLSATANDTLLISSALLYGSGTTGSTITTNDNLTLLSRDTATARFGEIVTGSSNAITGKVNVERYISTLRKWRHLAWSTTSTQTAMQSWMENNAVANGNTKPGYGTIVTDDKATWLVNAFDSKSVSGPSVKYYNVATNTYIGIPNTTSYAMNSQSSYYNFVRGDRSCTPANYNSSSTILRSTGTLKTGNQVFNVTASKFASIGNPYASAIDLRLLDTLNLTSTFYVWDPKLTGAYGLGAYQTIYAAPGGYKVLPGGGSYGLLNSFVDTLESGQAMFVRARASAGTLTFKESSKTIGKRTMSKLFGQDENVIGLLSLRDLGGNTLVDGAMVNFDTPFSNLVDYDDALKMINTSENASFRRDGQLLAIERRQPVTQDDTLFLNISGVRIHAYQWDIIMENMDAPGRTAFFVDKYLNTQTPMNLTGTNSVIFDIQSPAGSWAPDRFMIIFKQTGTLSVHYTTISAVRNPNKTVTVNWNAQNEIYMDKYFVERSLDGVNFTDIGFTLPMNNNNGSAGYSFLDKFASEGVNYYRVRGRSINGQLQYTSVVKVGPLNKESSISIYPNPVTDGVVNLHFENQPKGTYTVTITNKIGQLIHTEKADVQNSNTVQMISLGNIASGSYQATVKDESGTASTISFIVR